MRAALTVLVLTVLFLVGCGKPNIEASCTMNGFGIGRCEFLNDGDGKGRQNVEIVVYRTATQKILGRTSIKSGIVEAGDVRNREFLVEGVQGACTGDILNGQSWTDVCHFNVVIVE